MTLPRLGRRPGKFGLFEPRGKQDVGEDVSSVYGRFRGITGSIDARERSDNQYSFAMINDLLK
jgi:hypothetical protein